MRVNFQNFGPQPQFWTSLKAKDSTIAMSMAARKYNALLITEHRLHPQKLEPQHG